MHETELGQNRHALHQINHLVDLGCITETNLNGLTTIAGLLAAISAVSVHETDSNFVRQAKIIIQRDADLGYLTDTEITAAGAAGSGSRISTLKAALTADDSQLTANDRYTFAF